MRSSRAIQSRKRHGLTLIELVVVVAVLAILAGFIIPRLGFVRNLAAESGNATIIGDSSVQAVFYNTAVGHYPGGEDSLLDTGGALYVNLNPKLSAALAVLDVSADANAARSIVGQIDPAGVGFTLYAGTPAGSTTPNSDFTNPVTVNTTSGKVAQIKVPVAADVTGNKLNYQIYLQAYGASKLNTTSGAPLDGTYLVALGYGQNSEINGKTGLEPPVLFDKTPGEYTRPILLLKVFPTGSTAIGVPPGTNATTSISIGFDGTTASNQLAKYAVDQNR